MAGTINAPAIPVAEDVSPISPLDTTAMNAIKKKIENRIPLTQEETIAYAKNPDNQNGYRNSSDMADRLMNPKSQLTMSTSARIAAAARAGKGNSSNGV